MPDSSSALLLRVRKLLALATSPNVHEAAAAAGAAQALIERHRLQAQLDADADAAEDAARDPITDGREAPLEVAKRPRKWKLVLASSLAAANGCVAYTTELGRETHILLAGRASDREAAAALWEWLVTRIEWLSATHGAGRDRAWHDAFRIGAAEVIVGRLREGRDAERAAVGTAAMERLEPAVAARAAAVTRFSEERLRLKPGRGMSLSAHGLASGRSAGGSVGLPDPGGRGGGGGAGRGG